MIIIGRQAEDQANSSRILRRKLLVFQQLGGGIRHTLDRKHTVFVDRERGQLGIRDGRQLLFRRLVDIIFSLPREEGIKVRKFLRGAVVQRDMILRDKFPHLSL